MIDYLQLFRVGMLYEGSDLSTIGNKLPVLADLCRDSGKRNVLHHVCGSSRPACHTRAEPPMPATIPT